MAGYRRVVLRARDDAAGFWGDAADKLIWRKKWRTVLDSADAPFYRWFDGGELNTCENAVDRHVQDGYGEQAAIIYDSPLAGIKRIITYAELQKEVARLAGALSARGIGRGDVAVIYMGMTPEAVFAMLACARLGAVHAVVFGGFGAKELAARIDDAGAKIVLASSCGLEPGRVVDYKTLLDEALQISTHKVNQCLILRRAQLPGDLLAGRDEDWHTAVANAEEAECVAVSANDPLYILHTSGTTGKPKGIVRDNGGHAAALLWTMRHIYDIAPGETYWAASDIGWVVGHSYIVYAPLLNRNTTILYEGKPVGTPDAGAFWRVIDEHKVASMFTAPTAVRAIKKEDPKGEMIKEYDMSKLRSQFLAGERSDPDTIDWLRRHLRVPVIDHWWQTETGWAIAANPLGIESFPIKTGSAAMAMPGYDLRALDNDGKEVAAGQLGNLAVKLPLPPGAFVDIWGGRERMRREYFSRYRGFYLSGDSGMIDGDGYVHIMSRIDDVINVAAHRLSTGQMEEVLTRHTDVAEAAVFGIADSLKGELPLGLVVLNNGVMRDEDEICKELIAMVRAEIGAVAAFKKVATVKRLPKTRSGKILRATMRKMANGEEMTTPPTIDDPMILEEIAPVLAQLVK